MPAQKQQFGEELRGRGISKPTEWGLFRGTRPSLDDIWASNPRASRISQPAANIPEPARRYLTHAIAPVSWAAVDTFHPIATTTRLGHEARLELTVDATGRLQAVKTSRWGNPEGGEFRSVDFGAMAEGEATFHGYTIPTRLRVGWHFVDGRFESGGEFFRVVIDEAAFR